MPPRQGGSSRPRRQRAAASTSQQPQPTQSHVASTPFTPLAPSLGSREAEEPNIGVDWDLFATVLSRTARDHERRKSRIVTPQSASQITPTGTQRRGRVSGATDGTATPLATARPILPDEDDDDLDLPSVDGSQFGTYDDSVESDHSLPSINDSQFSATADRTASPIAQTRMTHVKEDDNESIASANSLPSINDSQFEPSSSPVLPISASTRSSRVRQSAAQTPRATRQTSTASSPSRNRQASSLSNSLPPPDDSQFEETIPRRVTRAALARRQVVEAIREESQESEVKDEDEDEESDNGLPEADDSQFEQTMALSRGELVEMEEAEAELFPPTPIAIQLDEEEGAPATTQGQEEEGAAHALAAIQEGNQEEEVAEPALAKSSVAGTALVEEERVVRVEELASHVEGTTEFVVDEEVIASSTTGMAMVIKAAPTANASAVATTTSQATGTAEQPVLIDDAPAAPPALPSPPQSPPAPSAPALAQPLPAQIRSSQGDPTAFASPEADDLTEVERRGEEPVVAEPEVVLHGPRKPRARTSVPELQPVDAAPALGLMDAIRAHVAEKEMQPRAEEAFQIDEVIDVDPQDRHVDAQGNDDPVALDEPLIELDTGPVDIELLDELHADLLSDGPSPADAPLQTPSPPDPYMVDEDGSPLRTDWTYVIPKGYAPPKSRIHGQLAGQGYKYSRLDGRRIRWLPSQSLLLWRTVQKVPLSVENPMDVVTYLYGEFGVRSTELAFYNKQHMRQRMVVVCDTRNNRGLVIEGRARMFLGPKEPRRRAFEQEKEAWRNREQEETLRVKREETRVEEEEEEEDEDEDEDDEQGEYPDYADYANDDGRPADVFDDDVPENRKRRAQVDHAPRKHKHARAELRRSPSPGPSSRPGPSRKHPDPSSDREAEANEPQYHRRRLADFDHHAPFTLDAAPTPPSSPPSWPPARRDASSVRRQSAPGRMRARRPRASMHTAFDDVMERASEEIAEFGPEDMVDEREEEEGARDEDRIMEFDDSDEIPVNATNARQRPPPGHVTPAAAKEPTEPNPRRRRTTLTVEPPPVRDREAYDMSRIRCDAEATTTPGRQRRAHSAAVAEASYEPSRDAESSDDTRSQTKADEDEAEEGEGEGEDEEEEAEDATTPPRWTRTRTKPSSVFRGMPTLPTRTTRVSLRENQGTRTRRATQPPPAPAPTAAMRAGLRSASANPPGAQRARAHAVDYFEVPESAGAQGDDVQAEGVDGRRDDGREEDADADAEASQAVRREMIRQRVLRGGL